MIKSALNFWKREWKSECTHFFSNEWELSEAQKISEHWTRWISIMILTVLWFKFSIHSIPFILKNLATKLRHPCILFDTRIYVHYRRGTCKNCTYLCYFNHEWGTFWACLPYRALNFISALVHVLFTKSSTFYTFLLLTSFCLYMMSFLWNRKVLSKTYILCAS